MVTKPFRYWAIRLYYFFFLGAFSIVMPYLTLFFRRQGMSGVQIGIIGTLSALIGIIFAPVWGSISDRINHPRRLLQIAFTGSAISYLFLGYQRQYFFIIIFVAISAFLLSGIDPISDTMALKSGEENAKVSFGSIRLWGSLGWASFVYLAGLMIEEYGIRTIFWGYFGLIFLVILVLNVSLSGKKTKPVNDNDAIPYKNLVNGLLKDSTMIGLAMALSVLWLVRAGIYQFQAIFMSELGAVESMIGLVSTITALVELPSMLWADRLINKIGAQQLIKISLLLFTMEMGVIVLLPIVEMFLVSAVLNGIAFSFFNVALIIFVNEKAPFAQTATVLALLSSTLRGGIQVISSIFSGLVYDHFGAYWLYVFGLGGCLVGIVIYQRFAIRNHYKISIKN